MMQPVNKIKSNLLYDRFCKILWEEMTNEHKTLLFHTLGGGCLSWVFELCSETSFFVQHPSQQSHCLTSTSWLQKLAYLAKFSQRLMNQTFHCKDTASLLSLQRTELIFQSLRSGSRMQTQEIWMILLVQSENGLEESFSKTLLHISMASRKWFRAISLLLQTNLC